jgi:2-(3-amino-3-carboxypropyl)histidine synthase
LDNKLLDLVIKELPSNYNFEIHKCIWWVEEEKLRLNRNLSVLLQLPQGLMIFASRLADIFENFTQSEVIIVADENYGACCIED